MLFTWRLKIFSTSALVRALDNEACCARVFIQSALAPKHSCECFGRERADRALSSNVWTYAAPHGEACGLAEVQPGPVVPDQPVLGATRRALGLHPPPGPATVHVKRGHQEGHAQRHHPP